MLHMPILRFELEGVKETIHHMFTDRNDELNNFIIEEINNTLNEEWVRKQIQDEVRDVIHAAVVKVKNNQQLQNVISDMISDRLIQSLQENDK